MDIRNICNHHPNKDVVCSSCFLKMVTQSHEEGRKEMREECAKVAEKYTIQSIDGKEIVATWGKTVGEEIAQKIQELK